MASSRAWCMSLEEVVRREKQMKQRIELTVEPRQAGRAGARGLRVNKMVPGNIYGGGLENANISLHVNDILKYIFIFLYQIAFLKGIGVVSIALFYFYFAFSHLLCVMKSMLLVINNACI